MNKPEVTYRRPLNDEQLSVLRVLYCYRFGTCKYLAKHLGKNDIKVVQKKLKVLEEQDYVAKRYEKTYKLLGKPAEYYLTPKGARALKNLTDPKEIGLNRVTEQGIKNLYKNPTVSHEFILHCLNVLEISLHFYRLYGDRSRFFTRMQLIPVDFLPAWRPDGLIAINVGAEDKAVTKRFFLDVWDGTRPFFVSVRKARSYIAYSADGDWPTEESKLPIILMLCDSERNQAKLRRQIRKALEETYEEIAFATATTDTFRLASSPSDRIWSPVDEEVGADVEKMSLLALPSE